jgi:hypothetical protein
VFDGLDNERKLIEARRYFDEAWTRLGPMLSKMKQACDFADGQQWDPEARDYLKSQMRPVLTFNMIAPIARELFGANEDARRVMRVAPVGDDDAAVAEMLNHIKDRLYAQSEIADIEGEVFERALAPGVAYAALDVQPEPEQPDWVRIELIPLGPFEILPDPDCRRPNLKDAKYIFWHRWFAKSEFEREYPEHAAKWNDLMTANPHDRPMFLEHDEDTQVWVTRDYDQMLGNPRYFDRNKNRLRVIHMEYMVAEQQNYALDPRVGMYVPVERKTAARIEELGLDLPRVKVREERVRWLEFTGAQLLYDGPSPMPFRGFSVVPLTCYHAYERGEPYGIVRDLVDPQKELNKRYSEELNLLQEQVQPGLIADQDAFADPDRARRDAKTAGSILFKTPGMEVRERVVPTIPAGTESLLNRAQSLLQMIAGVSPETLVQQQSATEPVGTALLRWRRSQMAISGLIKNYRGFQRRILSMVVETVINAAPDSQIEQLLGDRDRYQLMNGDIMDNKLQVAVALRDLRALRYQIEHDEAADNTTMQLLLLQLLAQLSQTGIPVPPEIVIDAMPIPRDQKQRMRDYVEKQAQAQSEAAQADSQAALQQVQGVLDVEAAKVANRARADTARINLERDKTMLQFAVDAVGTLSKVEGDQKSRFLELLKVLAKLAEAEMKTEVQEEGEGVERREPPIPEQQPATPQALGGGRSSPASLLGGLISGSV